jgi:PLP dependent protein
MNASFIERLNILESQICAACERANRPRDSVTLIAVSKTHPASVLIEAAGAGVQHFGENRVEESMEKIPLVQAAVTHPLRWHMIGHVQSRKAREVAPLFDWVHSVDSVKVARKLADALPQGKTLDILLEMNVSGEASKSGFAVQHWHTDESVRETLIAQTREIAHMDGLRLCGLMTVAPIADDMQAVRPVFRRLRFLRDALEQALGQGMPDLSMGMTDDFPVAIEEGATLIRVGRALFGERA